MTNENAAAYFSNCLKSSEGDGKGHSEKEPYELAISALKKQMPEKPTREGRYRYCNACRKILAKRYYAYCPHCGQKVKK